MISRTRQRRSARVRRLRLDRRSGPIGIAIIVLATLVLYVAYRANLGLPWQSRYQVYADVADADRLIKTADVRIGGVLVGEVLNAIAEPGTDWRSPYARLKLAISHSVGRLPINSTVQVRPESVLGLTYVDIVLGTSHRTIPPDGTLPLASAKPSSDVTDLFDIFNRNAGRSFQAATSSIAVGLAGRGTAINASLGSFSQLLPELQDVASAMSSPNARLSRFISGYTSAIEALAPVDHQLADLLAGAATTFSALDAVPSQLAATIDEAPRAESATTTAFIRVRPALDGLARLATALRPTAALLPRSVQEINLTVGAGVKPLQELPSFARPLRSALRALERLADAPSTSNALRKLYDLVIPTRTVVGAVESAQVDCDVLGLWSQNIGSAFGALGTGDGPAVGLAGLTTFGALGEALQNAKPSPNLGENPLPIETKNHCEAGNEPYTGHQQLGNLSNFHSGPGRTTVPPPGVTALAAGAGLLKPIPGIK